MYTVGSLFAGIGGFDLAFTTAGFDIAYQVEIDEYCRQVLSRHWPDVPKYKDVCEVGSHNLPPTDVICGGFPCQDISLAGKRTGIRDGTRSGLWFEMARIIGELRPRIVLLENVAAITTAGGGGVRVIADLAEMGYDARWGIIRASDAGAPHQRARWWCVAYCTGIRQHRDCEIAGSIEPRQTEGGQSEFTRGSSHLADPGCTNGETRRGNSVGTRESGRSENTTSHLSGNVAHSNDSRFCHEDGWKRDGIYNQDQFNTAEKFKRNVIKSWAGNPSVRQTQPGLGRNANGLSYRLDAPRWPAGPGSQHDWEPPRTTEYREHRAARLKALGNAVVPQVVYPLAVMIREWLDTENK